MDATNNNKNDNNNNNNVVHAHLLSCFTRHERPYTSKQVNNLYVCGFIRPSGTKYHMWLTVIGGYWMFSWFRCTICRFFFCFQPTMSFGNYVCNILTHCLGTRYRPFTPASNTSCQWHSLVDRNNTKAKYYYYFFFFLFYIISRWGLH